MQSCIAGFAHLAGGAVGLKSVLGRGTTITHLPAESDHAIIPEHERRTILLVEDNPEVATVSIGLLEHLGYNVRWAADASAALVELEKDRVDIVFSDVVMP